MSFGFFLREAIRALKRNAVPSFAAMATVLVTVLVLGVFMLILDFDFVERGIEGPQLADSGDQGARHDQSRRTGVIGTRTPRSWARIRALSRSRETWSTATM